MDRRTLLSSPALRLDSEDFGPIRQADSLARFLLGLESWNLLSSEVLSPGPCYDAKLAPFRAWNARLRAAFAPVGSLTDHQQTPHHPIRRRYPSGRSLDRVPTNISPLSRMIDGSTIAWLYSPLVLIALLSSNAPVLHSKYPKGTNLAGLTKLFARSAGVHRNARRRNGAACHSRYENGARELQ